MADGVALPKMAVNWLSAGMAWQQLVAHLVRSESCTVEGPPAHIAW